LEGTITEAAPVDAYAMLEIDRTVEDAELKELMDSEQVDEAEELREGGFEVHLSVRETRRQITHPMTSLERMTYVIVHAELFESEVLIELILSTQRSKVDGPEVLCLPL
jgi:hypothetical protein